MSRTFIQFMVLSCLWLAIYPVQAKIYTCIENGDVVYTSNPKGNCAQAKLPEIGRYSEQRPRIATSAPAAIKSKPRASRIATAYHGPQPSVNIVPKGSDNTRRAILQQELANEREALNQAQQALNRSRTGLGGNITQLQSAVLDRQQNIQALQRELGRM